MTDLIAIPYKLIVNLMALERADRFLSTPGSVLVQLSEELQEMAAAKGASLSHFDQVSKMTPSPSQCSLDTRASRGNLSCEKEEIEEHLPRLDCSPYAIRNLSTGEVLDLRDECNDHFPETFAKLTSTEDKITKVREL